MATRYFSNAHYPEDVKDPYEVGSSDVAWGRFSDAVVTTNHDDQIVVTSYYYNRSTRDRLIAIKVEYK